MTRIDGPKQGDGSIAGRRAGLQRAQNLLGKQENEAAGLAEHDTGQIGQVNGQASKHLFCRPNPGAFPLATMPTDVPLESECVFLGVYCSSFAGSTLTCSSP